MFLTAICSFMIAAKEYTLVIDPGHGGKDYGAIGALTNEKTINLAVAKKLGELVSKNLPEVKVTYTRDTDTFVSLKERADIANRAKGDLFISIHVNSVDKRSRNRTTVAGAEVYTLGLHKTEENLAVARRENSVMQLEADYSESYRGFDPNSVESYIIFELNQSRHLQQSISFAADAVNQLSTVAGRSNKGVKQAGFWVLWATGMPSVLVELDFICNPTSERFLASEQGQDKMAEALFNAFKNQYKPSATTPSGLDTEAVNTSANADVSQESAQQDETTTPGQTEEPQRGTIDYRIQILASETELPANSPRFKSRTGIERYSDKGMYKYTLGHYTTFEAARQKLRDIRKTFPEAFIVKMQGDTRIYD